MSNYNPSASQPQLLTPQFFEQPPKLLPPSVFRQTVTASCKSEDHQENSDSTAAECSTSTCDSAVADQKSNEGGSTQSDHSVRSKKIKLCSESEPVQDSFNPRCDNQLLLVAENVSYSLAAKQRWMKSAIASNSERKIMKAEKVLEHNAVTTPTSTIDQRERLPLDTPTLLTVHLSESTTVPETALSRSFDSSTISSVNDLSATHSAVLFPSPAFIEGRGVSNDDKPLISASWSPSHVSFDNSCRNDLDKVYRGPATKPHTTDNLKLSDVESPSTELDISSWKIKSQSSSSSSSTSHSEVISPTYPKDPCHLVDAGKSTSVTFVKPVETMASAAVDTESDHILAQELQNEEYGHISGVPGQYVVEQDVKRRVKKPTMDCSSDFELARRLQQEVDAEVAHSMQRQEDRRPPRSGGGRRLGTSSDDDDVVHESVSGYYDNNNQYCYTIREHVGNPDVRVGTGARGSSSLTRRPLSSHHHHYHPAAVLGEDMDMSYEALVQLEDVSRGLDRDAISRLSNTYKYHPSSSIDKSCSVCLCEFESGELLRSLPCIHAFHKNCIDKWLTDNRHCPVCMKDIDSMIT